MKRLLVLCFLLPSLALAQTLADAEALYADGELSAALKTAEAALKGASSATELSKLHVLRGLVLLAQNKQDKAKAAFTQALQADAGAQLDPQRVPPRALPVFEQAREAVPPGSVSVSTAGDATVQIDGVDFGPLPLTTRLAVGRHVLEAKDSKAEAMRAEVLVKSGEAQSVVLTPKVVSPPPPEPVASTQPTVKGMTENTRVTLLEDAPPAKQTYWGLIPIIVAVAGGWLGPPMMVSRAEPIYLPGAFIAIGATGVLSLGTALLASSAVEVESASGGAPLMNWWGALPLGLGLLAVPIMIGTHPNFSDSTVSGVSFACSIVAILGVGVGAGMLVGRALAINARAPKVSFFFLQQGGGLTVSGRF